MEFKANSNVEMDNNKRFSNQLYYTYGNIQYVIYTQKSLRLLKACFQTRQEPG
jgi:hypothetical protein